MKYGKLNFSMLFAPNLNLNLFSNILLKLASPPDAREEEVSHSVIPTPACVSIRLTNMRGVELLAGVEDIAIKFPTTIT